MAKWSLDLIGVPVQYRTENPYTLTRDQQLDAFPKAANPDFVDLWMEILKEDEAYNTIVRRAWHEAVLDYVRAVESKGGEAFVRAYDARNRNEHVSEFLRQRRRRVVAWIDKTHLLRRPIWASTHEFIRKPNSLIVRAQVQFRPIKDGIKLGEMLQNQKFFRTSIPWARGNVWYRWFEYGVTRIVWSAQGATDAQLTYEIHCPYAPELTLTGSRNISDKEFNMFVDDHIWQPIVRSQRWTSTSNPKTWQF